MHDPLTVAFEIKNPFARRYSWGRRWVDRPSLITVWHRDPESDGSDDSCGWFGPGPPAELVEALASEIVTLAKEDGESAMGLQRDAEGAFSWWILWLQRASFLHRARPLPLAVVVQETYHASFPGSRDELGFCSDVTSREGAREVAGVIARAYMRRVRPWWRHPRWHFWHWRIQVHPWQRFMRRFVERCDLCGQRFRGASAFTNWDGGSKWCQGCDGSVVAKNPELLEREGA